MTADPTHIAHLREQVGALADEGKNSDEIAAELGVQVARVDRILDQLDDGHTPVAPVPPPALKVVATPTNAKVPAPRAKPYVTALPARKLFADHTYQRDLDVRRVNKMAADFDPTLLGVLEVSDREDGTFAILEGQHRWAAATTVTPHSVEVHLVCQVHRGLTRADEARMFYEIDVRRRSLSGWDRWKARRGAGDPVVAKIEAIVAGYGFRVSPDSKDGCIGSTHNLEQIFSLGGQPLLMSTFNVLTATYRTSRDAYDGSILFGLALILHSYDTLGELDVDRLILQLQTIVPRQIKARAVALREAHKGQLARLTAAVMIDRYNAAPGRKVEEFFQRVPSLSKLKRGIA